ncbi:hypothetical protein Clacol_010326 [Clathrus columnatus]|uniref:Ricin B lectin domain-containing protein n=1 Tax=Clathrus columnatus TaxID=1419009 RepID=A0AAV5AQK2_9AGAM|nr:hypothetical protein Clacol_010326 [Clathrus columnatus]
MTLNGIYNIVLNGGKPDANSAAVGTRPGVNLVELDNTDPLQKWSIKPVGGTNVSNAYLIQSAYTGQYVVPYNDTLAFSRDPYVWLTTGIKNRTMAIDDNPMSTFTLASAPSDHSTGFPAITVR